MSMPERKRFTYEDYLAWPDEMRCELIDGVVYDMCPAPEVPHQDISMNLSRILSNYLLGKPCKPYAAPTDVILSENDVVQPDFMVVCDRSKINTKGIFGAPDLIIEILSPSTSAKDRHKKKNLYQTHGVKEYILLDPDNQSAEQFLLDSEGKYSAGTLYSVEQEIPLQTLGGFGLPLKAVFGVENR